MKRICLMLFYIIISVLQAMGQIYEIPKGALNHKLMSIYYGGHYEIGSDGLYHFVSNPQKIPSSMYNSISSGNEHFFCYYKKEDMFFFYTDNLIGAITPLDKSIAKDLLKSLKEHDVKIIKTQGELVEMVNEVLEKKNPIYKSKNDSISEVKRMDNKQFVLDSLVKEKQKEVEMHEYRKTHDWHKLDLSDSYAIYCKVCGGNHYLKNNSILSLSSDTIYYLLNVPDYSLMGIDRTGLHYSKMTKTLKSDRKFIEYIRIWRDSIANNNQMSNRKADAYNEIQYEKFKSKVNLTAPNGFIIQWGWKLNSADGIEPYFTYFNSSKKRIKYVDLFFCVFNAVGDKCYLKYDQSYTGKIRGTGPIDSFKAGSWKWDRATHYTSGDASDLKIVKLVITYMDGTIKTLTKDSIQFDN